MNNALKIVLAVLVLAFVVPVVWEYVFIRFGIGKGFAVYGAIIIELARTVFSKIGHVLGRIVSILDWIGLQQVVKAVERVGSFYFQFFTSWWWTFIGFFSYMSTLNDPFVYINLGVICAAAILFLLCTRFPSLEQHWKSKKSKVFDFCMASFGLSIVLCIMYAMYTKGKIPMEWVSVTAWF